MSSSGILVNLKTAHLLCRGSIIFDMLFAIMINLQCFAVSSIILRKAVCASAVISSASSKIMSLKGMLVSNPENLANFFTLSLTMLMPRSSEAFNSKVYSRHESPRISFARHNAVVVLPTPADPENNKCGISDVFFKRDRRLPTISFWFIIDAIFVGRYFSTHIEDSVIGTYVFHLLIKLSLLNYACKLFCRSIDANRDSVITYCYYV